jgi:two-component system, OmpR family, response regulator ResD
MAAGLTVLVIDDDVDYVASVQSLLESEGHEVVVANSGRAGLAAAASRRPDLIVLDIMMESTSEGYAVNQALRFGEEFNGLHDVPIVMVSSIRETPDERFGRAGEVDLVRPDWYLTKPLEVPRFLELVSRAAARKGRRN